MTSPKRTSTWGLGEALLGAFAGFFLSILFQIVVVSVWPRVTLASGKLAAMSSGEKLTATALGLVGLWIGLAGSVLYSSRTRGKGSLREDFGLVFRPIDIVLGIAAGVGCQLVLIPLLYLPFEAGNPTLTKSLSQPAHQLVGGYHGMQLVLIGLMVSIGAPIVEEVFFRGLLLRSLINKMVPALGQRAGVAGSVIVSALVFAL
ncbi:MAG TPA: CPBP family intramembrane glutamic endopeptidase, partial [Acidimicrobiales bacterium]|nr:CPBP family intramembrane glutamic endopeptidase [Acidimicrobiales bacterium]